MTSQPSLPSDVQPRIDAFKAKWLDSQSAERSNSQLFLTELTDLMGVPHPSAAVNDPSADTYVFERKVQLAHAAGGRVGWIDLYKAGCFVLESKQGAHEGKKGFAKRDTPGWENEMEKARGQAKGYAQTLPEPPPFIIVCDVGHVFEIHSFPRPEARSGLRWRTECGVPESRQAPRRNELRGASTAAPTGPRSPSRPPIAST